MNKAKIEACEKLCQEFLERAKALKNNENAISNLRIGFGSLESGALRRTSMDLTRALADLRRAG